MDMDLNTDMNTDTDTGARHCLDSEMQVLELFGAAANCLQDTYGVDRCQLKKVAPTHRRVKQLTH